MYEVLDGTKKFKAILLNYEDETFIKVILDPESLKFFKANLYKIKDGLSRAMVCKLLKQNNCF